MLKIKDSITLAKTKFKIRRIRLVLSLIIISILCSFVILGYLSLEKSAESLNKFSNQGLNGRFLATVYRWNNVNIYDKANQENLYAEAENLYKQQVEKEKKIYKQYGLEYYEDLNQSPVMTYEDGGEKYFNYGSKIANEILVKYLKENYPATQPKKIEELLTEYKATNRYQAKSMAVSDGALILLENGKEPENHNAQKSEGYQDISNYMNYMSSFDDDLTKPFFSENYKLKENEIPILVNYSIAEKFLNIKPLDNSASEQAKYDRIQELRERISENSKTFCWRNNSSKALYETAVAVNKNKDSKVKYDTKNGTCETPIITTDERTKEEKMSADEDIELQKSLGKYQEPRSKLITFRPIGAMPEMSDGSYSSDLGDFLQTMTSSTLDHGSAVVPRDLYEKNVDDETKNIFQMSAENQSFMEHLYGGDAYIAEFSSAEDLRNFIKNVSCESEYCGPEVSLKAEAFSNNSAIISDAKKYAMNVFLWILLVSSAVISLVIYIVINRIMADSRKETAVFRAIGYSRFEISQIYITYIALFAIIAGILITIISAGAIFFIKNIYEPQISLYFTNFFALNKAEYFTIVDFSALILLIVIPIFVIGLIAATIPLIINTRRSPLKNLRSE